MRRADMLHARIVYTRGRALWCGLDRRAYGGAASPIQSCCRFGRQQGAAHRQRRLCPGYQNERVRRQEHARARHNRVELQGHPFLPPSPFWQVARHAHAPMLLRGASRRIRSRQWWGIRISCGLGIWRAVSGRARCSSGCVSLPGLGWWKNVGRSARRPGWSDGVRI